MGLFIFLKWFKRFKSKKDSSSRSTTQSTTVKKTSSSSSTTNTSRSSPQQSISKSSTLGKIIRSTQKTISTHSVKPTTRPTPSSSKAKTSSNNASSKKVSTHIIKSSPKTTSSSRQRIIKSSSSSSSSSFSRSLTKYKWHSSSRSRRRRSRGSRHRSRPLSSKNVSRSGSITPPKKSPQVSTIPSQTLNTASALGKIVSSVQQKQKTVQQTTAPRQTQNVKPPTTATTTTPPVTTAKVIQPKKQTITSNQSVSKSLPSSVVSQSTTPTPSQNKKVILSPNKENTVKRNKNTLPHKGVDKSKLKPTNNATERHVKWVYVGGDIGYAEEVVDKWGKRWLKKGSTYISIESNTSGAYNESARLLAESIRIGKIKDKEKRRQESEKWERELKVYLEKYRKEEDKIRATYIVNYNVNKRRGLSDKEAQKRAIEKTVEWLKSERQKEINLFHQLGEKQESRKKTVSQQPRTQQKNQTIVTAVQSNKTSTNVPKVTLKEQTQKTQAKTKSQNSQISPIGQYAIKQASQQLQMSIKPNSALGMFIASHAETAATVASKKSIDYNAPEPVATVFKSMPEPLVSSITQPVQAAADKEMQKVNEVVTSMIKQKQPKPLNVHRISNAMEEAAYKGVQKVKQWAAKTPNKVDDALAKVYEGIAAFGTGVSTTMVRASESIVSYASNKRYREQVNKAAGKMALAITTAAATAGKMAFESMTNSEKAVEHSKKITQGLIKVGSAIATASQRAIINAQNDNLWTPAKGIGDFVGGLLVAEAVAKGAEEAWKHTWNTYVKLKYKKEIPIEQITPKEVIEGKTRFPKSKSVEEAMQKFRNSRPPWLTDEDLEALGRDNKVLLAHTTPYRIKSGSTILPSKKGLKNKEDALMYGSPANEISVHFTRVGGSKPDSIVSLNIREWFNLKPKTPHTYIYGAKDIRRVPRELFYKKGFKELNEWYYTEAPPQIAFLTKRSEIGLRGIKGLGAGTRETESGLVPYIQKLVHVKDKAYYKWNGWNVPIKLSRVELKKASKWDQVISRLENALSPSPSITSNEEAYTYIASTQLKPSHFAASKLLTDKNIGASLSSNSQTKTIPSSNIVILSSLINKSTPLPSKSTTQTSSLVNEQKEALNKNKQYKDYPSKLHNTSRSSDLVVSLYSTQPSVSHLREKVINAISNKNTLDEKNSSHLGGGSSILKPPTPMIRTYYLHSKHSRGKRRESYQTTHNSTNQLIKSSTLESSLSSPFTKSTSYINEKQNNSIKRLKESTSRTSSIIGRSNLTSIVSAITNSLKNSTSSENSGNDNASNNNSHLGHAKNKTFSRTLRVLGSSSDSGGTNSRSYPLPSKPPIKPSEGGGGDSGRGHHKRYSRNLIYLGGSSSRGGASRSYYYFLFNNPRTYAKQNKVKLPALRVLLKRSLPTARGRFKPFADLMSLNKVDMWLGKHAKRFSVAKHPYQSQMPLWKRYWERNKLTGINLPTAQQLALKAKNLNVGSSKKSSKKRSRSSKRKKVIL